MQSWRFVAAFTRPLFLFGCCPRLPAFSGGNDMKRTLILASCVYLAAAAPTLAQYPKSAAAKAPAAAPAAADTAAPDAGGPATDPLLTVDGRPRTPDGAFVAAAAQSGLAGVTLGRIALEKSARPEVRKIAQDMVQLGERMSADVTPLLKAQHLAAPIEMDTRQKKAHEWLLKLSGTDFDRAFVASMTSTRTTELMVFQRAADRAHDPALKAWAARTLPSLQAQQEALTKLR
jgi:putative membrane protein